MDNLQIRVTLTNGKGWRETKTINLEQYEKEKLLGNDLFEKTLNNLIDQSESAKIGRKSLDDKIHQWRP
jgi:hypothetical protein